MVTVMEGTQERLRAFFMLFILVASTTIVSLPVSADDEDENSWNPYSQPWAQYGRDPGHTRQLPAHGDTGLMTIETPAVNWEAFDSGLGADGYGVAIADMTASISAPDGAKQRCGQGHLFAVMTHTDTSTSDRQLAIIEGDTAKTAWEVNLGDAKYIRSTPIIVDVNGDLKPEIAVVYDTDSSMKVDLWSPEMSCDESGWSVSGHSNEKLWSWSDEDLRLGITSPHFFTRQSNHLSVTQPLLADLSLDGSPELVISAVDTSNDEPTVISLPLGLQSPEANWEVALDRGTHPSDPSFAALDDNSGAVVLTTVDSTSGNMWIWRIDGDTGSLDWERVSIQGTDDDGDTPRLRLPGPVITQLDNDAAPEMILTLPADDNGATDGMGAQYVGMELTSTDEVWRFRAKNGYADAEPIAIDTTDDGITDRVCWVTWYSDSSISADREGMTGCHDITIDPPFREWTRTMQRGGDGNDNDEIAVAAPISIDLDGEDEPELLVAFGRRIWAFDGDTGAPADISTGWSAPIDVSHRVWASPAIADMDGDGYLDILVGDALISEAKPDLAPLSDGRGIGFTPIDPDPGEMVTISGQYSNIGIVNTDEPVDAVLLVNGVEVKRHRVNMIEPVAPSGEGGPITFSVDIEATLGVHEVELRLDVNNNLTQSRVDNDNFSTTLVVLEPHVAQIQTPSEVQRALPGSTEIVDITVTSIGSRNAAWTLSHDNSQLPAGWTFSPVDSSQLSLNLERDTPQVVQFEFGVPNDAMGSDDAVISLTLSLDQDENISTTVTLPLEVERTRGLSLQGPTGLPNGIGFGRPGDVAHVWMMVENVGNAEETTELFWSSNSWTANTTIVDYSGITQYGIDLAPGASEQFLIEVEVPSTKIPGDSTSATLTLCIGSGSDEICEDFFVTIYVSQIASEVPHIRTVPTTGLSWNLESTYTGTNLRWDMSEAGMLKSGWAWSATGDLTINGTMLEMTGQNGELHLDLPYDAQPMRHYFNQSEEIMSNAELSISLHVLQVYRASAEVITPENMSVFNVEERTKLILRLENPGNGEDTFTLVGSTTPGNLSEAPNATFEINNPTRTLGAGGMSMVPVWVTLPEDVPARERFEILFEWTSQGDTSVADTARITIEARPDHRWDISVDQGYVIQVDPGQELDLTLNLTNIGNTDDLLTLLPQFGVTRAGQDQSIWVADLINSSRLNVLESESLVYTISIPDNCWNGTVAELSLQGYSNGFEIGYQVNISLIVNRVSGWRLDLSNTSLEVSPTGGELSILVEQLGNSPSKPYFTKAGQGWNVSIPTEGVEISPGESGILTINVTPPSDAIAGEVGVVNIRISDGNGAGQVVEQVPVRVGSEPGIIIDSSGHWKVTSGIDSFPTAWVENTGNDVAIMELSIDNVPSDWNYISDNILVVAPSEITGIPVQLNPANNWNGNNIQVDIVLTHPTLGEIVYPLTVSQSTTVLTTNPVHTGRSGDKVSVTTYSESEGYQTSLIPLPETRTNTTHNGLTLHLYGIPAPVHTATCSNQIGSLSKLGIEALSLVWATCELDANQNHGLVANAWLKSSSGEILDSKTIRISAGDNSTVNLSIDSWDPEPGPVEVEVLIVDSNGVTLFNSKSTQMARQSGWNLKLANLIVDDDSIDVGIDRNGYQIMEGSICAVEITSASAGLQEILAVDIYGSTYAPSVSIERPASLEGGHEVTASIACNAPWDIDDNPGDDSQTIRASNIPLVTYESSDIYWTGGIAILMLILAYFGGVLNLKSRKNESSDVPEQKEVPQVDIPPVQKEVIQVVNKQSEEDLDDISFGDDFVEDKIDDVPDETDVEEETMIQPEQEAIDIDDATASGRLSALRREMATDTETKPDTKDDLSRRLDSFLKDR